MRADAADPLAPFREEFALPEGMIYLDGNSLGAQPQAAAEIARQVVQQDWGQGLISSWNAAGWFDLPVRLGDQIAALIGAASGTTVVTDTTSLNLFRALAAAVRIQRYRHSDRRVILSERDNFPSDLYVVQGLIEHLDQGYELRLVEDLDSLERALTPDVAVVTLSHVNYRTGAMWDLPRVTAGVRQRDALIVWDLAHSAGVVPIDLTAAEADFAVGCSYKYLNGGPGSPGFLSVSPRHLDRFDSPVTGWWGHARPFAMEREFAPADGARRLLTGTQPVVSLALAGCGLSIASRANMTEVRRKSLALTELFIALVEQRCAHHSLRLVTPRDPARRGSQVCFDHPDGFAIVQALISRGVVGDYREPGILRFGLAPLYLRQVDVWDAVEVLRDVLDSRSWDSDRFRRRLSVT
jgi:kynureninase